MGIRRGKKMVVMVEASLIEILRYWFSAGDDLLPRGHLAMSGNYPSGHTCGSMGWRTQGVREHC